MSSNANLQGQELSSFSKVSLGWLNPKVVKQGEIKSLYLGNYSFVAGERREAVSTFNGPMLNGEYYLGDNQTYDVLSLTPEFSEPVYRSAAVVTDQLTEKVQIVEIPDTEQGHIAAYSGKFDGEQKTLALKLKVPAEGDATLKFDMIWQVETETNFATPDPVIKVVTDYDMGHIVINGENLLDIRTISGDTNSDTLAEENPACEADRVLELRLKSIDETITEDEKIEFSEKTVICSAPIWKQLVFDLSDKRGQEIELEIRYVTDAGYTEFGIVVDNVTLGEETIDFEQQKNLGEWTYLEDGLVTNKFSQFYLLEYRTPSEVFKSQGSASYNMDNNIDQGGQSFFLPKSTGLSTAERYRMVTMDYQPGVLVWYFNGKYTSRAASQG